MSDQIAEPPPPVVQEVVAALSTIGTIISPPQRVQVGEENLYALSVELFKQEARVFLDPQGKILESCQDLADWVSRIVVLPYKALFRGLAFAVGETDNRGKPTFTHPAEPVGVSAGRALIRLASGAVVGLWPDPETVTRLKAILVEQVAREGAYLADRHTELADLEWAGGVVPTLA